jgi:hypothetical protein
MFQYPARSPCSLKDLARVRQASRAAGLSLCGWGEQRPCIVRPRPRPRLPTRAELKGLALQDFSVWGYLSAEEASWQALADFLARAPEELPDCAVEVGCDVGEVPGSIALNVSGGRWSFTYEPGPSPSLADPGPRGEVMARLVEEASLPLAVRREGGHFFVSRAHPDDPNAGPPGQATRTPTGCPAHSPPRRPP